MTAALKLRRGLLGAGLACAAVAAVGAGTAQAKLVVSDTVVFKGTPYLAGEEMSTKLCTVRSDGEKTAFKCGVAIIVAGLGGPMVKTYGTWLGLDGEGLYNTINMPLVVSKPPNETYEGTGPCSEYEESDQPGTGGLVTSQCTLNVKFTYNVLKNTLKGKYVVSEEATQP